MLERKLHEIVAKNGKGLFDTNGNRMFLEVSLTYKKGYGYYIEGKHVKKESTPYGDVYCYVIGIYAGIEANGFSECEASCSRRLGKKKEEQLKAMFLENYRNIANGFGYWLL